MCIYNFFFFAKNKHKKDKPENTEIDYLSEGENRE